MDFPPMAGIILAGGSSRRMGRNKALLPLPGDEQITFVEHLVTMLTVFCPEIVLVVRNIAHVVDYTLPDVRIVPDQIPDQGPLMGLASGLSVIDSSHALVMAVDMPFVQPEILAFLLAQPRTDALLVPVVSSIPQVLLAIYPKTTLPLIEKCLHQGQRSLHSLLEVAPVRFIEETQLRQIDPVLQSFVNVNTPEELRKRQRASHAHFSSDGDASLPQRKIEESPPGYKRPKRQ